MSKPAWSEEDEQIMQEATQELVDKGLAEKFVSNGQSKIRLTKKGKREAVQIIKRLTDDATPNPSTGEKP